MGLKIGFMEVGLVKIGDKYNNSPRKRKLLINLCILFYLESGVVKRQILFKFIGLFS